MLKLTITLLFIVQRGGNALHRAGRHRPWPWQWDMNSNKDVTQMWRRCHDVTQLRWGLCVPSSSEYDDLVSRSSGETPANNVTLFTPHSAPFRCHTLLCEWMVEQTETKEIYKGESKADNEQTKNTPYSADAVVAVFIQWDNRSENRECSVALHKRFTLRSPLYISLQKTF